MLEYVFLIVIASMVVITSVMYYMPRLPICEDNKLYKFRPKKTSILLKLKLFKNDIRFNYITLIPLIIIWNILIATLILYILFWFGVESIGAFFTNKATIIALICFYVVYSLYFVIMENAIIPKYCKHYSKEELKIIKQVLKDVSINKKKNTEKTTAFSAVKLEKLLQPFIGKKIKNVTYQINAPTINNWLAIELTNDAAILVHASARLVKVDEILFSINSPQDIVLTPNEYKNSALCEEVRQIKTLIKSTEIKKIEVGEYGDLTITIDNDLILYITADISEEEKRSYSFFNKERYVHLSRLHNKAVLISGEDYGLC